MLIDSKSQLAKLLATENIIVEQQKVPTAYFHIKDRRLVIPILADGMSTYLYDLMCGHEVGHALNTPEEGWHDSIVDLKIPKSIVNVVEDARIEKLIKRKYPGLRASFVKAYRELMEKDFFDIKNTDVNKLNLIDRLNLHFKVGASLNVRFNANEKVFVSQMENLETWDDVIATSQQILAFMKAEAEKRKEERKAEEDMSDDDADYEMEKSYDFDLDSEDEDEGELVEDEDGDIAKETKDESEEEDSEDTIKQKSAGDEFNEDLASHTDEAFREREKELLSDDQREHVYANIPKVNLDNVIFSYKDLIQKLKNNNDNAYDEPKDFLMNWEGVAETHRFTEFRNKSNKVVSYLVKEFELRKNAQQMKKASVSKTGDLDMKLIHKYAFSEDLFKRVTNVPNGKSHGLVMFIDWSGSMSDNLGDTVKQLLNLVLFCRKTNIPFEVYAFSNKNRPDMKPSFTSSDGDLNPDNFTLFNLFSNKMTTAELNYIANCLLKMTDYKRYSYHYSFPEFMSLFGTPLNEAIIAAMEIIPKFREQNKLQIVNTVFLTDGDGTVIDDIIMHRTGPSGTTLDCGRGVLSQYRNNVVPVFRHKKTNLIEKVNMKTGNMMRAHTIAYLNILKKVAECNVVGFYLLSGREAKSFLYANVRNNFVADQMLSEFRKQKSVTLKSQGYDEYYLMKADTKVDEDDEIVAKSTTTRGLVSAFTKYNNTRHTNRVILSKFIGMIS